MSKLYIKDIEDGKNYKEMKLKGVSLYTDREPYYVIPLSKDEIIAKIKKEGMTDLKFNTSGENIKYIRQFLISKSISYYIEYQDEFTYTISDTIINNNNFKVIPYFQIIPIIDSGKINSSYIGCRIEYYTKTSSSKPYLKIYVKDSAGLTTKYYILLTLICY